VVQSDNATEPYGDPPARVVEADEDLWVGINPIATSEKQSLNMTGNLV
jgi:hypothetical protein